MRISVKNRNSGFTLVELLVVIAIIGLLSTLLIANLNATRERARDTQRKSDLRNIQTALRLYYNDYNHYPTSSGGQIMGCGDLGDQTCTWGKNFIARQTYMNLLPSDPLAANDPTREYSYTQTDADVYSLQACLENLSDERCGAACDNGDGCLYIVQP